MYHWSFQTIHILHVSVLEISLWSGMWKELCGRTSRVLNLWFVEHEGIFRQRNVNSLITRHFIDFPHIIASPGKKQDNKIRSVTTRDLSEKIMVGIKVAFALSDLCSMSSDSIFQVLNTHTHTGQSGWNWQVCTGTLHHKLCVQAVFMWSK